MNIPQGRQHKKKAGYYDQQKLRTAANKARRAARRARRAQTQPKQSPQPAQ